MNEDPPPDFAPEHDDAHPFTGYRTNTEWNDLIAQTGAMITSLDRIDDEGSRDAVFGALAGIDQIHREALHRLVRLFKDGVLEQVITDPAIKTLMGMYDLLPRDEPACQKVWDFTKDSPPGDDAPARPVSTEIPDYPAHWSPAPIQQVPGDGEVAVCRMDEGTFLLAVADGQNYVVNSNCGFHDAPMEKGRLQGLSLICPHGPACAYDIRNGARLGGGAALDCLPVKSDASGRILIGFGIPFEPNMPSF